jgi:carboxypeptidase PM20D1
MWKKIAWLTILTLVLVAAVLAARTALLPSQQVAPEQSTVPAFRLQSAAGRLAAALRFRTISQGDTLPAHAAEFLRFHDFLRTAYPHVHQTLTRETVSEYSLLYRWQGEDVSAPPVVLMAHMDVVPVDDASQWQVPPFEGRFADGFIWGRGALDDKASVIAVFEAVEALIRAGIRPRRTVYLAVGHDEEAGGWSGARRVADLLRSRGVRPAMVLDEGGGVAVGLFAPLQAPVAFVSIAEKGILDLELLVHAPGGHSSAPPRHTAIGQLARAIQRVEAEPLPLSLGGVFGRTLEYTAPEMAPLQRVIMSNLWLTGALVKHMTGRSRTAAALVRTTQAVTIVEGGVKSNVLPTRARAVINFRLLPGDTDRSVMEHVRRVINDPEIELRTLSYAPPSTISDVASPEARLLQQSVRQIFPQAVFAPGLSIGATDARHFTGISSNVYRFAPFEVTEDTMRRMHGRDERIAADQLIRGIRFYAQLLLTTAVHPRHSS